MTSPYRTPADMALAIIDATEQTNALFGSILGPVPGIFDDAATVSHAMLALLAACELWDQGFTNGEEFTPEQFRVWVNKNRAAARAAIAKAKGEQS